MIDINYFLWFSALLFALGFTIAVSKKNLLMVLIGIELMLNAANINFVVFSHQDPNLNGQLFALVIMIIAAAEVAIGLAIIFKLRKLYGTMNPDKINELKY